MLVELTASAINEKWAVNVDNVTFIYPHGKGTRLCFVGDKLPLEVNESYEEVKAIIKRGDAQ